VTQPNITAVNVLSVNVTNCTGTVQLNYYY
jgi:hypothetical protein